MRVSTQIEVERAPEDVAAFVMDPSNDTRWIGGIRIAEVLGDPTVGRGTRVRRTAKFLGRTVEYVNEIDDWSPPRRLAMHSVQAPFPMRVAYEFEPRAVGTLVRVVVEGEAGRFYAFAGPLLARAVGRSIAKDLRRLKSLLEAPASRRTAP